MGKHVRTWLGVGALLVGAACTSSSSPPASGSGSGSGSGRSGGSSGSSGSSGASSSGSGSGGSSGSSSGSSGGSSGSSGSSSGGAGNGAVQLTPTASPGITGVIAVGGNLYWVDAQGTANAAIKTVPGDGGTVKTLLSDPTLDWDLASDGTHIYFSWTSATVPDGGVFAPSEIDSIAMDGTGRTSLATGFSRIKATSETQLSELFLAGNNLYFLVASSLGNPQVDSVPVGGGGVTEVVKYPDVGQVLDIALVDATGLYFTLETTQGETSLSYEPLGSSTISTLYDAGGAGSVVPSCGQVADIGGTIYFLLPPPLTNPSGPVTLMKTTPPATATQVSTYPQITSGDLAGDATTIYAAAAGNVYTIDPTSGAHIQFYSGGLYGIDSNLFLIDSKNIYYATVSASTFELWSVPR